MIKLTRLRAIALLLPLMTGGCQTGEALLTKLSAPVQAQSQPAKQNNEIQFYYQRAITDDDLKGRTLRELTLMRNTIYARAGNPFRKKWLHDYFTAQPWYHPLTKMDEKKLTELDRQNAAAIANYEANLTREELMARQKAVTARRTAKGFSEEDKLELSLLQQALGSAPAESPVDNNNNNVESSENDPLSDYHLLDKLVTVEQLADYSPRDLRILRNMIYARHGRPFKSAILKAYFGRLEWYKPDPKYTDARLTEIDRRNIKIILSVENELGGPLTEREDQNFLSGA